MGVVLRSVYMGIVKLLGSTIGCIVICVELYVVIYSFL